MHPKLIEKFGWLPDHMRANMWNVSVAGVDFHAWRANDGKWKLVVDSGRYCTSKHYDSDTDLCGYVLKVVADELEDIADWVSEMEDAVCGVHREVEDAEEAEPQRVPSGQED